MAGDWKVNAGRLWAVGATTAVVAGLAAVLVWLFATQVFDETLYVSTPSDSGLVELSVGQTFIVAFLAGIVATGLMHLMLAFVPRGSMFFGLLATLVLFAMFIPVLTLPDATTANMIWLSIMHVVVYLVIVPTLTGSVPRVAMRLQPIPPPPPV